MESSAKTAWLSILINLLLVGIKTTVVFISGSLAVTADAIHSLSDVVSSTVILLDIKISERPARGFPYGLFKLENLVAMATSVMIVHHDQVGRGPGFVLGNAGVEILLTQETNVEKALVTVGKDLGYKIKRDIQPRFTEIKEEIKEKNMALG